MIAANFNKIGKSIFVHKLKQFSMSDLLEDDERLQTTFQRHNETLHKEKYGIFTGEKIAELTNCA
jgi:hypothetical protein